MPAANACRKSRSEKDTARRYRGAPAHVMDFEGDRLWAWTDARAKLADKFTASATNAPMLLAIEGLSVNYGGLTAFARGFGLGRAGTIRRDRRAQRCRQDDLAQGHLGSGPDR